MSCAKFTTDLQWQISNSAACANNFILVISVQHYYLAYAGAA